MSADWVGADEVEEVGMNNETRAVYSPGDKVTTSGYAGTVIRQYSRGMYEVRLAAGLVCVDVSDIRPAEVVQ